MAVPFLSLSVRERWGIFLKNNCCMIVYIYCIWGIYCFCDKKEKNKQFNHSQVVIKTASDKLWDRMLWFFKKVVSVPNISFFYRITQTMVRLHNIRKTTCRLAPHNHPWLTKNFGVLDSVKRMVNCGEQYLPTIYILQGIRTFGPWFTTE